MSPDSASAGQGLEEPRAYSISGVIVPSRGAIQLKSRLTARQPGAGYHLQCQVLQYIRDS